MADAREEGAVNTYAKLKDEYHTIQGVKSIELIRLYTFLIIR